MCADEMTTGSVMVSPQDRKTLAARSHAFNIQQRRFKQLFPAYSGEGIKDLPNMGEVEKTPSSVPKGNDDGKTDNGKVRSQRVEATASTDEAASGPRVNAMTTTTNVQSERTAPINKQPEQQQVQHQHQHQQQQQPHRTRAVIPLIVALFAYLFFSRLMSSS